MSVNHYFQSGVPGVFAPEQNLLYDMIDEAISINGVNVYYMPRTLGNVDYVFTEDTTSSFNNAYIIEMYLENTQGYDGDSSFLSKFGVEIRQSCSFTVSRRRWEEVVGSRNKSILNTRPVEGDLLYFPLTQCVFEITKVVHDNPFYQMGKLFTYRLDCELFQYGSEVIKTGIAEIDAIMPQYSIAEGEHGIDTQDNLDITDEEGCEIVSDDYIDPEIASAQNNIFKTEAEKVLDFSNSSPFNV